MAFQDVVRDTDDHELGPSVAHFFNCFFGNSPVVSEKSSSGNLQRRSQKKVLDSGGEKPFHLHRFLHAECSYTK